MSNHSSGIDEEMQEKMGEFTKKLDAREEMLDQFRKQEIGPTGRQPEGKLTQKDDGEITFAVGIVDKKVVIDFNIQVSWLGMMPNQAKELGELLIKRANDVTNSQFK